MIELLAEIKGIKAVVVVGLLAYAGFKRRKSRKKRFAEIKERISTSGELPDHKFPIEEAYVRQFNISKKKKHKELKKIIGLDEHPYIEIRSGGIYFSILFLGNSSYKKVLKHGQPYIFIPWQDIKSIKISSPEAVRFLGSKERYAEDSISLLVRILPASPSNFIGKKIYINLGIIKDANDLQFLVKHYARDLFKQKV